MGAGIVWLTGIPASGKTTIARRLASRIRFNSGMADVIDGDEARRSVSSGLGFGREDRKENARRIGWGARLLARNGVWAVVAAISPYREDRAEASAAASAEGLRFIEVFCDCDIETAKKRDPKGLYKMATQGFIRGLTGFDAPYERPKNPDVSINTAIEDEEESTRKILGFIFGQEQCLA